MASNNVTCSACGGAGGKNETCGTCRGKGCNVCQGGTVWKTCNRCNGWGTVKG